MGGCALLCPSEDRPVALPSPRPFPTSGPAPETSDAPDALSGMPRYSIRLHVDLEASQVTGEQVIQYTNTEEVALRDLYLRLFPNTPSYGGHMRVMGLMVNGAPASPEVRLDGSALRLFLHPPLAPLQALTLTMAFTVSVPLTDAVDYAQFAHIGGVMALPNVYPLIPVYDDEGWNVEIAPDYGDAVYSDVAFYQVEVTAPPTVTLIATGVCATSIPGTWQCEADRVRDFVLILGNDYEVLSQVVDGVRINSYFYSADREGGTRALQVAGNALALYSRLFGSYPYGELDVVETPTRAGGIEYPTLVVISDHLYRSHSRLEWVVAHEVAHQWWYGVVGNDQVDEPWLDEALTQYSTFLYHEFLYGSEVAAEVMQREFQDPYDRLVDDGQDMPVGLPVAAYPPDLYGPVVYRKGPLYFHALRQRVGDEKFFAFLRTYYRRHQFGIATPESLLDVLRTVTGDAQRDLYDQWIQGRSG
ncbi:MAG: M1 family metallopeptidase [Anaerolineae bacterium]|nr:M1 family metallopeptidase [Anaerolineae bacterium]